MHIFKYFFIERYVSLLNFFKSIQKSVFILGFKLLLLLLQRTKFSKVDQEISTKGITTITKITIYILK